jgi:heptose-I-phosphate ethanolaminephosphotransferase
MVGGHGRVPSRFRVFSPNSGDGYTPVSRENAPILVNDYDNMILLQDYVLSELIHLTDKQGVSAVLLFAPDHGSNLFDDGTNLFAYGSAHPTEKETHIPLFIWGSHDFVEGNEKFSNLRNHKNLLTTNNDIFSTLADLANIQYESFVRQKSIADSSYVEPSSRFVYVHNEVMEFKR